MTVEGHWGARILTWYITENVSEMECTTASPSPPLFHPSYPTWAVDQEFKMLQDVAVNEPQKDAGCRVCARWNLCKEEMREETQLISLDAETRE